MVNNNRVNDTKQIAPFLKELLEYKTPLFDNNLNGTKQAICHKMLQKSVNAKNDEPTIYADQTLDFASCLIVIQQFERDRMGSLEVDHLNLYE